jgi:hypothetical protein
MSDIEQLKQGKRYRKSGSLIQMTLDMAVRMWPTPSAMDGMRAGKADDPQAWTERSKAKTKQGINLHLPLNVAVRIWPTPTVQMAKHASPTEWEIKNQNKKQKQLHIEVQGQLNPDWVEWLMGWPIHWTSLKPLKKKHFEDWQEKMKKQDGIKNTAWWTEEPDIPRVAAGVKNRVARLKALGNGQVPAVVSAVWRAMEPDSRLPVLAAIPIADPTDKPQLQSINKKEETEKIQ